MTMGLGGARGLDACHASDEVKSTQLTTIRHQLFRIHIADVTNLDINDTNTKKLMSYGRGLCGLSFV